MLIQQFGASQLLFGVNEPPSPGCRPMNPVQKGAKMFNGVLYGAGTAPGSVCLQRIPEMVGGEELWRSSSPSSLREQDYCQVQSHCMDGSVAQGFPE